MTIVQTTAGPVEGIERRGILRFAGVPFAAPPVGALRFAPPAPVERWTEIRDASRFGPIAPQSASPLEGLLGAERTVTSEDCLTLNVFTPAADDARRPTMVWIHGGGFTGGSGSSPMYEATNMVTRGDVVVVTVNYRLGVLGFMDVSELDPSAPSSGLHGILDQVAALRWVRDNAAAFGGDPDNVTIFGESAGGMSVGTLLAAKSARGLFHRAIPQSGAGHHALSQSRSREFTNMFLELTGSKTIEDLRALSVDAILDAQDKIGVEAGRAAVASSTELHQLMAFVPTVDGVELSSTPIEIAQAGDAAAVDLLIGATAEEWRLFSMMMPSPEDDVHIADRLRGVFPGGRADEVVAAYRDALGADATTKDVFNAVMTDAMFAVPASRLADAYASNGQRTFRYRFSWQTPVFGGQLGACHAIELPFVWDNRTRGLENFVGTDSPDALAHSMQDAWIAFARSGDPGWPALNGQARPVMDFNTENQLIDDPDAERHALWEGVL